MLLDAAKAALAYFIATDPPDNPLHRQRRDDVIAELRSAIDICDKKFDDSFSTIELLMTPLTDETLREMLKDRDDGSEDHKDLLAAYTEGRRVTKRRIYVKLPISQPILRRLRFLLDSTSAGMTRDKAFKRFSDQIKKEGLDRNPLEILAHYGL